MKTTLNIDDKILERASQLTGVKEKTTLVRLGLEALIARESSKRLASLAALKRIFDPFQDGNLKIHNHGYQRGKRRQVY